MIITSHVIDCDDEEEEIAVRLVSIASIGGEMRMLCSGWLKEVGYWLLVVVACEQGFETWKDIFQLRLYIYACRDPAFVIH